MNYNDMPKELRNIIDPGWDHPYVQSKKKKYVNPCIKGYKEYLKKINGKKSKSKT